MKEPRSYSRRVIWLLRHADAADGSPDSERELTKKGRKQARNAGLALKVIGVKPDACFTSPKVSSADTAKLACEQLGVDYTLEPKLAGGPFDPEALAAGLEDVLLVGHEPDFSMAVHETTGAQVRMKKGGLAGIEKGELRCCCGRPSSRRSRTAPDAVRLRLHRRGQQHHSPARRGHGSRAASRTSSTSVSSR